MSLIGATLTGRGSMVKVGWILLGFKVVLSIPGGELMTSKVQGISVNGKPLIWLGFWVVAPLSSHVIDKVSEFFREYNSNIHRGAHQLAGQGDALPMVASRSSHQALLALPIM